TQRNSGPFWVRQQMNWNAVFAVTRRYMSSPLLIDKGGNPYHYYQKADTWFRPRPPHVVLIVFLTRRTTRNRHPEKKYHCDPKSPPHSLS
ncbi:hypothetical protein Anas_04004, partial [Armadillidium nasatum]